MNLALSLVKNIIFDEKDYDIYSQTLSIIIKTSQTPLT